MPTPASPDRRPPPALEQVLAPLLDLFEAGAGVDAEFRYEPADPGAAMRYARGQGLMLDVEPAGPWQLAVDLRDGPRRLGRLAARRTSGRAFPPRATRLLESCGAVVAAQLAEAGPPPRTASPALALLDPITGLANRQALLLELERMLARAQRDDMAVLVVSLALGCDGADRPVAELAACLAESVRGGDLVARTGESAFAIVGAIPRMTAEASAAVVLARLDARCAPVARGEVEIGFSIAPIGAYDAREVLEDAESAATSTAGR